MKKLFVSVPMKGRADAEIEKSIYKMRRVAEIFEGEEMELINPYVHEDAPEDAHAAVWYLGESIKRMSQADVFVGLGDPYGYAGCEVENHVANVYRIKCHFLPIQVIAPDAIGMTDTQTLTCD